MKEKEQRAIMTICLMAAFTDGIKDERERAQIKGIFEGLALDTTIDMPGLYREVLLKRRPLEEIAADLDSLESRQLSYEMAVCVCDADGSQSALESSFLERLRSALALDVGQAQDFAKKADEVAGMPLGEGGISPEIQRTEIDPVSVEAPDLQRMILNYSILNGALELLPQSLASMAILPMQMKMVYRIGKAYGYELDPGHIKDFAATLGVGLTGQYVEQMGRKLLGGLLKKVGGGVLGTLGGAATGSAISFATTYALGHVAMQYYAGGRTISVERLKEAFSAMLDQGRGLQARYSSEIRQKALSINANQISELVRQQ